jgi:prolyl oligopeptidase
MSTLTYPDAPRSDAVERIGGLSFPDPFRPLENGSDPAVTAWQKVQAELADAYVARLPWIDELRDHVARCATERYPSMPRFAGGRWFRTAYAPDATQAHVVVADAPFGTGRILFDPVDHPNGDGRIPYLSWLTPSRDGLLLALGVCDDGSEANTIRIVDVDSGRVLDDRPPKLLMDNWMGGAQWLPNSSAFFYVALQGTKDEFELRVFRHEIAQASRDEPEPVPIATGAGEDYMGVFVSRDGRWAVTSQNINRPRPVAVLDLHGAAGWRPFLRAIEATVAGHAVGDEFIAVTDLDAPRGRLVAIRLDAERPDDSSRWRVVVPENDAVLRSVTPVGDLLYLHEFVDTYSRVRVVDLAGNPVGEVRLPERGTLAELPFPLMSIVPRGHPDEFIFGWSSLTESWGTYRHRSGANGVEMLQPPAASIDAIVEDSWAPSADGTQVPYHVVRPPGAAPDEARPTLIYAYGGFNVPWIPQFPRAMAAFVEAGGVFVHAHLRGGGELGLEWWEGGRMRNKQNCYRDLYAVAEDLVAKGRTSTDLLAVTGGSNGGLMSGVAVTQRPHLWRVAVPRVPLLDVLGACREPYGRAAVAEELGDPDDPDDVANLASFSPYQLIEDGTPYPAVYLDVGDTDPRCPAWHGRKFAARLQEATTSGRPVLLRVWENVGHGWATAKDVEVDEWSAWLAFVIAELGMTPAFC